MLILILRLLSSFLQLFNEGDLKFRLDSFDFFKLYSYSILIFETTEGGEKFQNKEFLEGFGDLISGSLKLESLQGLGDSKLSKLDQLTR